MTLVTTPCTKICVLDPRREYCVGCGRSMTEIACWGSLGEADRERIMAELPNRLAARQHAES